MSPDQRQFVELVYAVSRIPLFAFWGCIAACWFGAFFGRLSFHGVWLYLRRAPRWRRFERAMWKVMP